MKRMIFAFITFLLVTTPVRLLAKVETTKITITGTNLKTPIQITDRDILANINVWTGPNTWSSEPSFDPNKPSFIVDWSQGAIHEPSKQLPRYQVSFYGRFPRPSQDVQLVYVVCYAFDPATGHGYVYLPGKGEESYNLNVSNIIHGIEGNWFHAWSFWENVANPLILPNPEGVYFLDILKVP